MDLLKFEKYMQSFEAKRYYPQNFVGILKGFLTIEKVEEFYKELRCKFIGIIVSKLLNPGEELLEKYPAQPISHKILF